MKAFILAGGFATRLWPLTEKRPKPLLPLAGKPLLTHLLEKIPEGISITVSTNQVFAGDFEKWNDAVSGKRLAVSIVIEDAGHEDEKLGALGALSKWITENNIQEDILLIAGDNYIGFSLAEFLQHYQGNPLLAAYDIGDEEKTKQLGTVVVEQKTNNEKRKTVAAFEEKPHHPRSTLVSTGCCILPASTLETVTEYAKKKPDNIGGIFEHFLQKGMRVECMTFSEPWFDIGSFEAYLEATKALVGSAVLDCRTPHSPSAESALQYTSILKSPLAPPATIMEHGNVFEGSVVIGDRSRMERSTLRNVVIFEDCIIEDCILEQCIIDAGCRLRGVDLTGKMLRARTTLMRTTKSSDLTKEGKEICFS